MNILKITFLLALASFFSACSSTINTIEPKDSSVKAQYISDKRIITDSSLADSAKVKALNVVRVGGLLKVQVEVFNSTSEPKNINYRFSWIDNNGMLVSSPASAWQTLVMEGREVCFISAVAPSESVNDFTLKLLSDVREY